MQRRVRGEIWESKIIGDNVQRDEKTADTKILNETAKRGGFDCR
jgi:hypothetical protein